MNNHASPHSRGLLTRLVGGSARAAARHPKRTVALWLALIVACIASGSLAGTRTLRPSASGTGESQQASDRLAAAGLQPPAVESILVRSSDPSQTAAAVLAIESAVRPLRDVLRVRGPAGSRTMTTPGGGTALVQVQLRGDPSHASDHVSVLESTVARVARLQPGVTVQESGGGSADRAITQIVGQDLLHSQIVTLPLTLVILLLAFGALVAASVPLLLGLSSVVAALGALGLVSQIAPVGPSTAPVVVVIGLAVGVDYSLFYIRREREERRAGRDADAALNTASATVGRAVVIAGGTVIVALAGLLVTGLGWFTSMALGAILVVAIAVIGSVTVLPALLTLLGDRIDRGRVLRGRFAHRRGPGLWARTAALVTGHPRTSLVAAVAVLAVLATPLLSMRTANPGVTDLPPNSPARVADQAINRAFPGSPASAQLVVTGYHLASPDAVRGLRELGHRALLVTRGRGLADVRVARGGETAVVTVPVPDRGVTATGTTVQALRGAVDPLAPRLVPGALGAKVTGSAAENLDVTTRVSQMTPVVVGLVLALAFVLLVIAFRSPVLGAAVIGLNLLSVGAAFGVIVAVFQHHWAEHLLGFRSNGAVVMWLPLFAFVVLFGLSMDYTVLMLERVREARAQGANARTAASEALTATGGTVTSAALVMIAVFAVFATLRLLEFKQLGVGLATAIALDATVVRVVALPAAVTLLGGRGVRGARARRPTWDHGPQVAALKASND